MKRIDKIFHDIQKKNQYLSSCTCFALAVLEHPFSPMEINQGFNRLTKKDDYGKNERDEIVRDLVNRRYHRIRKNGSENPIKMGVQKTDMPQIND